MHGFSMTSNITVNQICKRRRFVPSFASRFTLKTNTLKVPRSTCEERTFRFPAFRYCLRMC
jgi:hypothetical protein